MLSRKLKFCLNPQLSPAYRLDGQSGNIVVGLCIAGLLGVIAVFLSAFVVFGKTVPPESIGLRQNYFKVPGLGPQGFIDKGLEPGLHWQFPMISRVLLLPRGFQFVHFNPQDSKSPSETTLPSLVIPTGDGSKVESDVTVVYRIFEETKAAAGPVKVSVEPPELDSEVPLPKFGLGKHGGPKELVTGYSLDRKMQNERISQLAESELKTALGKLSTVDYYNPEKRETAALSSQAGLNEVLNPNGVEVVAALVRRYFYVQKQIDDQIFQKNLQEQTKRLNEATKRLAEEKAKTKEVVSRLEADIEVLVQSKTAESKTIESRGDLYETTKKAEGDLLVAKAVAEVDAAKERLLADSGSDIYVAYKMVSLLSTLEGGVVNNIDPYDLNSWVNRLTGQSDEEPLIKRSTVQRSGYSSDE